MQNKTILFTGAGFSAPANLPLQNQIIHEMTDKGGSTFLTGDIDLQSENGKFLKAYINTGYYLLEKYTNSNYPQIKATIEQLSETTVRNKTIDELLGNLSNFEIEKPLFDHIKSMRIPDYDHVLSLLILKNKIRELLSESSLDVNLEDVFTLFDKTMQLKEHSKQFTYNEIDSIRHSMLRLFLYYFGKKEFADDNDTFEYGSIIKYIKSNKNNLSIISTNWDTLLERSLISAGIDFNFCFNEKYYYYDDVDKNHSNFAPHLKLIKMHGSLNWFRCLDCGAIIVIEKEKYHSYIFNNDDEKCPVCNDSSSNSILLQPEIITPTMFKYLDSQLYKNLWRSSGQLISEADNIIFVGYSLPLADFELRYILQQNINPNTKIDVILHGNDNPSSLTPEIDYMKYYLPNKRYLDLFPKNQIDFFYDGFSEYFNQQ